VRRPLAPLLAAVVWSCGGDDAAIVGPPGSGDRFDVRGTPAHAFVEAGSPRPERLVVVVSARAADPVAGLEVRFRVLTGGRRLLEDTARTDASGLAAALLSTPGPSDSTVVRAWLPDDPRAAADLIRLARPVLNLDGDAGSVLAVPGAADGVLLKVAAGTTWSLVPYAPGHDAGRVEYGLLYGSGVPQAADVTGRPAPALAPAASPLRAPAGGSPLDVPPAGSPLRVPAGGVARAISRAVDGAPDGGWPGIARGGGFPPGGGGPDPLPAELDVANCRLAEHRPAPLAWIGRSIALYVDALEPPDSTLLAEIAAAFDDGVAPEVVRLFGPPVDLDGNRRVLAVLSRSMAGDGGVYCGSLHRFNREVVHTGWSPSLGAPEHLRLLAHEFQHVVHASQHFRSGSGAPADVPWLNEGFSHVAEWRAGYPSFALSRTAGFLAGVNGSLPLLSPERGTAPFGGWFLFSLYLGDRFGDGIYRRLGESSLLGRPNVERETGIPFRDLMRDWFVTLALAGSADVDADADAPDAWRYLSVDLAGEEERAAACACLPGGRLPGVAFESLPAPPRDVRLVRTLDVQDADFFRFTTGEQPAVLHFHAGGRRDVELFVHRVR
jgi:hypothetical protein